MEISCKKIFYQWLGARLRIKYQWTWEHIKFSWKQQISYKYDILVNVMNKYLLHSSFDLSFNQHCYETKIMQRINNSVCILLAFPMNLFSSFIWICNNGNVLILDSNAYVRQSIRIIFFSEGKPMLLRWELNKIVSFTAKITTTLMEYLM